MTFPKETPMIERLARDLAEALGDNFDDAFASKSEWIAARGESGGRLRDVNEPFKIDYIEAARAVLTALRGPTMAMKLAGAAAITAQMTGLGSPADYDAAHDSWQAMLDAALTNGEG